jgi:hypothetical protein
MYPQSARWECCPFRLMPVSLYATCIERLVYPPRARISQIRLRACFADALAARCVCARSGVHTLRVHTNPNWHNFDGIISGFTLFT